MNDTGVSKEKLEGQINVLREQIHTAQQNEEHVRSRVEALQADVDRQQKEGEDYSSRQTELEAGIREIEQKKRLLTEKLETLRKETAGMEQQMEAGKAEILRLLNARSSMKAEQQRLKTMQEQASIHRAQLNKELLEQKSGGDDVSGLLFKQEKELAELKEQIVSMEEEKTSIEKKRTNWQQEFEELRGRMDQCKEQYHKDSSRLESLRNIAERYDGYGNSIRRIMERKADTPGIHGVIADLIKVEKAYETAIETALGGSIQNIITDNEDTARQMIEYLKKNRYGRATFLPLTSVSAPEHVPAEKALGETGVIGIASSLVHTQPQYEKVAGYLLGRVLVMDTIEHAVMVARKFRYSLRIVTLEGESLQPGGSMTGGAFKNNSNLLGRRREIEELERSVGILRKELEETQKSIGENRSRRNVLRDTIADFQQKLRQQYVEQNTAKMNLEQLKEKEGEIQNSYRQIDREQEELRHQAGEIRQDHSSIARELEDSQKDEKELETFIETKQKELEEWKAEETEKTHELEKIRLEESSLEQQNQFLQENLSRLNSEIAAFQKESQEITENLVQSREEIHKKEEGIQELKNAAQECLLKEEQYGSQRAQWQGEKEKRSASHKTFFEKRDHLSEKTSLLDKECFRLRSQTEKIEEQREGQISYMWEEYEITPNNALQYRKEELTDRQAIKADVTRIKDEIRKLGSVNVNAIEDYKELLERHTFLSGQYDDIVKAEETLEGIILELDEGMRKQFTEKFRDIQREFDKAFKELFGGGKGTLELAEDEDILEAGIRIISQPPGKKLQNMMQLSGGEKALTAIALLFAIQNLKPSPFCLLDEIEAALDDSNVGRFASYLQKLTKNTQFIIITHRRGTMNAADRLYGITMQEKGVSTLVSVDLVENQLSK